MLKVLLLAALAGAAAVGYELTVVEGASPPWPNSAVCWKAQAKEVGS